MCECLVERFSYIYWLGQVHLLKESSSMQKWILLSLMGYKYTLTSKYIYTDEHAHIPAV